MSAYKYIGNMYMYYVAYFFLIYRNKLKIL